MPLGKRGETQDELYRQTYHFSILVKFIRYHHQNEPFSTENKLTEVFFEQKIKITSSNCFLIPDMPVIVKIYSCY